MDISLSKTQTNPNLNKKNCKLKMSESSVYSVKTEKKGVEEGEGEYKFIIFDSQLPQVSLTYINVRGK